jgi:hypothetical protein
MVYNNKVILSILALIIFACTKSEPLEENPLDPDAGDYEVPSVVIKSNIQPGETITSETINIALEGNDLVIEYRLRLDESEWTEWSSENLFTLDYLDEGDHTIYGQARYFSSDESEIISLSFIVDAVDGPSLMFFPRRITATQGETVTFSIMAEEVYDLAGLETVLEFDPAKVTLMSVSSAGLFDETGDAIFFYEHNETQGRLTITAAVWGDDAPSFTGTQAIAVIGLRIEQSGNITIDFGETSIFRDPNNLNITVWESIPGLIAVN